MTIDPACGMTVDEKKAAGSFMYEGTTYFFCSTHCLNKFQANPTNYLHRSNAGDEQSIPLIPLGEPTPAIPQNPVAEVGEFTCPMHPEIRQSIILPKNWTRD